MEINGELATHKAVSHTGAVLAGLRASRNGDGFVVETAEGIRKKFATTADAQRWLGAATIEAIAAAEPEKAEPEKAKPAKK